MQLIPASRLAKADKILFIAHLAIGDFTYLQNFFQAFSQAHPHVQVHIWIDEVRRTTDQWNPLKIAFDRPHEADFPAALMQLSWRDRRLVLRDMWRFVVLYKEFKWGRQIFGAAMSRLFSQGYPGHRWI
jgi:hypothetical protein